MGQTTRAVQRYCLHGGSWETIESKATENTQSLCCKALVFCTIKHTAPAEIIRVLGILHLRFHVKNVPIALNVSRLTDLLSFHVIQ